MKRPDRVLVFLFVLFFVQVATLYCINVQRAAADPAHRIQRLVETAAHDLHCEVFDARAAYSSAAGIALSGIAGTLSAGSIPIDGRWEVPLQLSAAVFAGLAAGATFLATHYSSRYDGCILGKK
jgi:hypothetical protein